MCNNLFVYLVYMSTLIDILYISEYSVYVCYFVNIIYIYIRMYLQVWSIAKTLLSRDTMRCTLIQYNGMLGARYMMSV